MQRFRPQWSFLILVSLTLAGVLVWANFDAIRRHLSTPQERYEYLLGEIAKVDSALRPAEGTSRQEVEKRFGPAQQSGPGIYNGKEYKDVERYLLMPGTCLQVQYDDDRAALSWITFESVDMGGRQIYFTDGGGVLGYLLDNKEAYSEKNLENAEYDFIMARQLRRHFGLKE